MYTKEAVSLSDLQTPNELYRDSRWEIRGCLFKYI